MNKEKKIVLLLAKYFLNKEEQDKLNQLLSEYLDWGQVVGYLTMHRIFGVAWATIKKYHLNNPKEKCSYEKLLIFINENENLLRKKQIEQISNMIPIYKELEENKIEYGALKGIALLHYAYDMNISRDFNDNDILIDFSVSDRVVKIAENNGYIFGSKDLFTGGIKSADRKSVMIRTMAAHELFPLIKPIEDSFIKYHIIDFQFSLELFSNSRTEDIVKKMISHKKSITIPDYGNFWALDLVDTLIFTMIHYYKEAIYRRKALEYKDLALYKLCDINFLLHNEKLDNYELLQRIKEYGLEKGCYYSFYHCKEIFNSNVENFLEELSPKDTKYLNYYFNDKHVKIGEWNEELEERLFDFSKQKKFNMNSH